MRVRTLEVEHAALVATSQERWNEQRARNKETRQLIEAVENDFGAQIDGVKQDLHAQVAAIDVKLDALQETATKGKAWAVLLAFLIPAALALAGVIARWRS